MNCLSLLILALAYCAVNSRPIEKRSQDSDESIDLAGWNTAENPGSKYIMDLYMSKSWKNQRSPESNTIRSLSFHQGVIPVCGHYNFSLSAINAAREYMTQSELHLYLNMVPPTHNNDNSYIVNITAALSTGEHVSVARDLVITESKYYNFDVQELVEKILKKGERFAVFSMKLYSSVGNYEQDSPLSCSAVKFAYEYVNADNIPLLIVNSYDPKIVNIDLSDISASSFVLPEAQGGRRKKRQSEVACALNEFKVTTSLLLDVVMDDPQDTDLIQPSTADIGICGGQCLTQHPDQANNHARYTNAVIQYLNPSETYPQYVFTKCCVPVAWEPLQIITSSSGSSGIQFVEDMVVTSCACVDNTKSGYL